MRFVFFWAQSSGVQGFLEGLGKFSSAEFRKQLVALESCVWRLFKVAVPYILGKKGRITYVCIIYKHIHVTIFLAGQTCLSHSSKDTGPYFIIGVDAHTPTTPMLSASTALL